ncbi:unnamed protein product [Prunus armeniaca]|uniref:Uncharacterized protein n=1 Tax=Prunus armeniaca TaxID=36596 RepID=A0A6J5TGU5_PRUAR|nr:unnamed protein product [Prunus armeniaca]
MAHNLNMHPSTLQLVQHSGNLPMVAKPFMESSLILFTFLVRIDYLIFPLEVLSWGPMAVIPVAAKALPNLMACVLLSNLGASITEVAQDALVAEYGQEKNMKGLQSYAFMASAAGGILGNLIGGYFLMKTPPRTMFLVFSVLLSAQLAISLRIREESLGLPQLPDHYLIRKPIFESIRKLFSELMMGIQEESIVRPLTWIVASIAMVPVLLGILNEVFVLRFSGLAEIIAQFKILPFTVLFASLCPRGCEGSLTSFLASALCLSSIASGFLGVGLASLIGVTAGDYSSLPFGILVQFIAALLPLGWLCNLPMSEAVVGKERKRGLSRRSQKSRRVGRVVYGSVFIYRRERESEA